MTTDFLMLNYTSTDFLINRSQFSASLFLEQEIRIKSPIPFFGSVTTFQEKYLLVFDFDAFLNSHFHCHCDNSAKLILIADVDSFEEENRKVIGRLNLKGRQLQLAANRLAIKVSNKVELIKLPLAELKLIPACLRQTQYNAGILGLRFPQVARIQYFIDSETILINAILNRRG